MYKTSRIAKFDQKNVVYLAFVGKFNNTETFKYGKSTNYYVREMTAHRKTFGPTFETRAIYETNYKDQVEVLLEKELKVRDLHRDMVFNGKKQTELFVTTPTYKFDFVDQLIKDIIYDFDCKDVHKASIELEKLKIEKLRLMVELAKMRATKKTD